MNRGKESSDRPARRFRVAEFVAAVHRLQDCPPDEGTEIAFLGRSNSGKSSAINAITGRKGLARSSKEPGRTRQIVFFGLPGGRLVDLPGYGYAKVDPALRRHWDSIVVSYLDGRNCLKGVVLVADLRRGVGDTERNLIEWCRRASMPLLCLFTKADKLSRQERGRVLSAIKNAYPGLTIQPFSALSGEGIEDARLTLDSWFGREAEDQKLGEKEKAPATGG